MLELFEGTLQQLVHADADTCLAGLEIFTRQPGFDESQAGAGPADSTGVRFHAGVQAPIAGVSGGREKLDAGVLREILEAEWSAVLGRSGISEDADFFEAGGTSLQAATLHLQLEVATRRSIPMLELFRDPTIDGMVATLYAEDWPLRPGIVNRVRAGRSRAPLFCITSAEANTVGYSLLARHLDDDQGVYVLQSPPEDEQLRQVQPSALPELATRYLESMRRVQPHGPYRFLSMCTGSHIALEMARQLEAEREQVEFFGTINTWALYSISRLYYVNRMMNIARYYLRRLREIAPAPAIHHAAEAADTQLSISHANYDIPADSESGTGNAWIKDVGFATRNPGLPKLSTRVTVFRLKRHNQAFWRIRDAGLGWSIHVGDVDIVPVSGDSHDYLMREPSITELAAAITDRQRSVEKEQDQAYDTENTTRGTQ